MTATAQQASKLPYSEIPTPAETYTAGTVVSRLIDGLGFRYYWASADLKPKNLDFKLNDDGRSTLETLEHIYDLSTIIRDAALQVPHSKETFKKPLTYGELREFTLNNLKTASDIFKTVQDLGQYNMIFKSPDGNREVPFWNAINGPISDSIWHCGQLASFRRASGNPINPKVNHFRGTAK
ncbi:hypothetical protein [Formosa haliotis]|uniref:hypothetical protein n=1 Tax=Formosa haliotis TaxID=1555194 RepID=UPI001F27D84A|nr:hypothetical protein [Formosa haliotis]